MATQIQQNIRSAVSNECYQTWFKDLAIVAVEGSVAKATVPNRYIKQWLDSHYRKELLRAITTIIPEVLEVQISVLNTTRADESSVKLAKVLDNTLARSGHPEMRFNTGLRGGAERTVRAVFSPKFRLESFIVGKCSRVAHAAAQSISETPAAVYNPLFIHGSQGLGKTHLLHGIGHLLAERSPALHVAYVSCEEFTNAYVTAVQSKTLDAFRARFRQCDALLVDDVQFLAGREKTQEEFLHTFDALRHASKQIVLCANGAPRDIKRLDPRLVARFQSGLVARVDAPDIDTKMALVREKAKLRGMQLCADAAQVLATHIESNIRELEGAVNKLMALAASESRAPDRELAILALRELGYLRSGPLTLQDILSAVSQHYHVSPDEIRSGKRHAALVHVRHMGMYLSKLLTSQSVAEIGRFYGNRDHATVLHAARKLTERLKRDEDLKHELQALRQVLGR